MLPNDLHTFLILIGGPVALSWLLSHVFERTKRFQYLTTEQKSWFVVIVAIVLSIFSYVLSAWDANVAIAWSPQLIYTLVLGGITNWLSLTIYHTLVDKQPTQPQLTKFQPDTSALDSSQSDNK